MRPRIFTRALAGSAAAVVLAVGVQAPAAAAQPLDDYDRKMVELINAERTSRGLAALQYFSPLRAGSVEHSGWMSATGAFVHDAGLASDTAAAGCGGGWGENIYTSYNMGADAAQAMRSYMGSPGHRANILDPAFRYVATGTVLDGDRLHNTQRFARTCSGGSAEPASAFYLSNVFSSRADTVFSFGRSGDGVLVGDWDGDGVDTVAVRRDRTFYVNDGHDGTADRVFEYGRPGDVVLVGDWDGDGVDTLAVRRGAEYHLKNSIGSGAADKVIVYGRPGDQVFVGDWNADEADSFAVRRGAVYYVRNSISTGVADKVVRYGRDGDTTLVGDWDGDGTDTLAVRRGSEYHIKNSISAGAADRVVVYGRESDDVLVGDWNGDGVDSLGVRRAA
ncbi:hypothetical protein KZX45_10010 [Georgenia sp. EYE_87]|uniref:CAP domain-containing protein n=1 Tax=Georgenia sp. EYE_87 TaxID=2853448 RepID=UPI0020031D55|nr:CAP domain-containing protein [Georgenia sp. EYE_87]MCK6210876.1 hypothetical protein [Georgenia sp. EYE_87]